VALPVVKRTNRKDPVMNNNIQLGYRLQMGAEIGFKLIH